MRSSRVFLLLIMAGTLVLSGWASLHLHAGIIWRDQPLVRLTAAQKAALAQAGAVQVSAFITGNPRLVRAVQEAVNPLKTDLPALTLRIVNPDTDPAAVKTHNITRMGQVVVQTAGKSQTLDTAAPEAILQTVLNLQAGGEKTVAHLQSSGERAFLADTGGSWRPLYQHLQNPNLNAVPADLTQTINIPANAALAVIADPDAAHEAHLDAAIAAYLRQGGSILYTTDTTHPNLPAPLAAISGLAILPGTVVDMAGQKLGSADPRLIPAAVSDSSPLTANLQKLPLLPGAVAFAAANPPADGWTRSKILQSSPLSWNETSPITGRIEQDDNEERGPLGIGWLLERQHDGKTQRIAILGDSDFAAAAAFAAGGNRDFAQNLITQLANAPLAQTLDRPALKDQYIALPQASAYTLAILLLLGLPCLAALLGRGIRKSIRRHYQHRLPTVS